MKIGIIGDIHANLDALLAVLEALDSVSVDAILCTGDVVGYGACPRECIDIIRELEIPCAQGNHDEYTSQVGQDWLIQPDARIVIHWNQEVLPESSIEWLAALPRVVEFEGMEILHSSHVWWPEWPYVINDRTAVENFLFQASRLTFNGHSHVPLCVSHLPGKRPHLGLLRNMFLPRKQRLLIGVGSVGQPRDGDPRTACVVYDSQEDSIRILRVPYDIAAAQQRIRKAGLPEELGNRLAVGR